MARTAALCLFAAAGFAWYLHRTPSAPTEATAAPVRPTSAQRARFSLVVLPFSNLGGNDLGDATVDAVTQDVTADVARYGWLVVTAGNSAFAYKGKPIDVRRVGQELGVRYVVEGSVRKSDGSLRVNVQLVSAETGAHVWADRFDVGHDGVGYGLDNIVRQIGFVLQARLAEVESARGERERLADQDLTDVLTRARAVYNLPPSREKQAQLLALYERAVQLDPSSAETLAGLAEALLESVPYWSTDDPTAPAKFRRAEQLIGQAELLRPDNLRVMLARVFLLLRQARCPELIPFAQRASEAHPLLSSPYVSQGVCLLFAGRAAEAVARFKQAIDVHPRNPAQSTRYGAVGYGLFFQGQYDEAISWFQKALGTNPGADAQTRGIYYAAIAAAQALVGDTTTARLSAAEAGRLWPPLTARSYFQFDARASPVYLEQLSRLRDGLRLAGIRDHPDEDADPGLPPDGLLHADYQAPTPIAVPGAQTIQTRELVALLEHRKPLVLDTHPSGRSIPGAIGLSGAGIGGSTSDEYQERLRREMQQLTGGDHGLSVVTLGWNAERYQGRNLALRLVALGYTSVYWYRGGREAWQAAGLPDAELTMQDW